MNVKCEWTTCAHNSGYSIPTYEGDCGECKFDGELYLKESEECDGCGYDVDNLVCDNFKY